MNKQGRKPYGFYKDEQAVVEVIRLKARKRKGGRKLGPWQIARELNVEGYKSQTGRPFSGLTVKDILTRAEQPPKPKPRRKQQLEAGDYLSLEQINDCRQALLNGSDEGQACRNEREKIIFETLLGSGLRASEMCDLQVRDLALTRGKSQIDVRRGKGAKNRSVVIGPALAKTLRKYLKKYRWSAKRTDPAFISRYGNRLTPRNLLRIISGIGERAGLESLHTHNLRHTFATFLYNYKRDLFCLKNQLGHSAITSTEIYAKTFQQDRLEQMAGFELLTQPKNNVPRIEDKVKEM